MENKNYENNSDKPLYVLTIREFIDLQNSLSAPKATEIQLPDIIGIEEAVKITGYKRSTIYSKTSTKTIPYHKRSGRIIFLRSELEAWMLENRQETIDEQLIKLENRFQTHKKGKA